MKNKKLFLAGGILVATTVAGLLATKKIRSSGEASTAEIAKKASKAINPLSTDHATALETMAFLESMSTSLMTRDSLNQGVSSASAVLSAKGVSMSVESVTNALLSNDKSYANRLFTRGLMAFGGYKLSKLPEKDDESLLVSSARSIGRLIEVASMSGVVYDSITKLEQKNSRRKVLPFAVGALVAAGIIYRGKSLLEERRSIIDTVPEDPQNKIGPAFGAAIAVLQVSRLIGLGFRTSRKQLINWYGPGPLKNNIARITNLTLWGSGVVALYMAGITKIGKANEMVEPYYSQPPKNSNVSGSPDSSSSFIDIGLQGRRYVTDVISKQDIKNVMGVNATKEPIRIYVGFNSNQKYHSARAELALDELERTKAYDRKVLLLVSPTGTGWIDQTMIESAELLAKGDIATCVVQYAKYPSFLSLQNVSQGRRQFRQLLWGVNLQISRMPASKRPKVFVFGESLGAWSSSDTIMHTGIDGFDYYGIDRALWVGMPGLSKWSKIEQGETELNIPRGTVRVFDRPQQYEKLSTSQKNKLRAIVLNHDNDPIAQVRPKLLVKRPVWLTDGNRGRGVPEKMEWSPITTFFQIAIDAGNAMRVIPGQFRSHGHDYRADMAYFVNAAYQFGADNKTLTRINEHLAKVELARAQRPKKSASAIQ